MVKSSKKKRIVLATLASVIAVGSLSACVGKGNGGEGGKIKYWAQINNAASELHANWAEMPLYKKIMEETGVDVEFIHPSGAGVGEQFSILIASEELPDIIQYNWSAYAGGPGKAIKDNLIIDLNQHKNKFPNLMKYLDQNETVKKNALTNEGELFAAPFIRGDQDLCVSLGIAIRNDWLKDLNLEAPETISEWENVLEKFKTEKGADAPLNFGLDTLKYGLFTGAYDTCFDYYLRDGKVTHGILDEGFKECLMKLNDWYNKGLIDKDFASINGATKDSNILNGKTGAMQMSIGNGIGKYLSSAKDEKFDLMGVKSPVLNKGTYPEFGFNQTQIPTTMNCSFTAITTDCKNVDAAAKFLDYGYSEEGHMLYNFGIEGESYVMVDGYPTYTDKITNNPEGRSMGTAMSEYCQSYDGGPFVQDRRYYEQYAGKPQQQAAWDTWAQSNMLDHLLPNLYVSGEDQEEFSRINSSLNTYMTESIVKLIMGTESFDNYDNIINEVKSRGIENAIQIKQRAYNSYLKR